MSSFYVIYILEWQSHVTSTLIYLAEKDLFVVVYVQSLNLIGLLDSLIKLGKCY